MVSRTEHAMQVQLLQSFGLRAKQTAIGMSCACHSQPFPAARDYRRRTRGRRRRSR